MDVKLLRESTRPEHEAVEAAVPLIGPDLTRAGYVATLKRFAAVIGAWDAVAAAHAPPSLRALVQERRRSEALRDDLHFFGQTTVAKVSQLLAGQMRRVISSLAGEVLPGSFLGAMYVVEGSTLGGQYIAHQVETSLGLKPGEGDRFFRGYGKDTMTKWRAFQDVLQQIPDEGTEEVITAAKQMFGIFQTGLAPKSYSNAGGQIVAEGLPASALDAS